MIYTISMTATHRTLVATRATWAAVRDQLQQGAARVSRPAAAIEDALNATAEDVVPVRVPIEWAQAILRATGAVS